MQQPLERRLHAGDGVEHVLLVDLDQLPGAAVLDVADVDVIAQQQQERLVADELLRLVDGVAEALGRVLLGEVQPLAERAELLRFQDRPVLAAERLDHVVVEPLEVFAVELLFARLGDDADLLDARVDRLFADDLDDRLGQPVAIDQREHLLLHRGRRRILPRAASRRR